MVIQFFFVNEKLSGYSVVGTSTLQVADFNNGSRMKRFMMKV